MDGYVYILKCCDGSYYTGSTRNLKVRLWQHQNGEGANYTKKDYQLNWFILSIALELMTHIVVKAK